MIVERLREALRPTLRTRPRVRMAVHAVRLASLKDSDVLLASYPRSGNTWTRFLVGTLLGRQPDFDSVYDLVPALGVHQNRHALRNPEGGRAIKTHEKYFPALPVKPPRALIVVRDGRDVAISYYHHQRHLQAFDGTFEEFFDRFVSGEGDPYGPWHEHVSSWLTFSEEYPERALVVRYEDLHSDGVRELGRMARFMGLTCTDDELASVLAANDRADMQKMEAESSPPADRRPEVTFARPLRKQWAEVLSDDQIRRFEYVAGKSLSRMGYRLAGEADPSIDER